MKVMMLIITFFLGSQCLTTNFHHRNHMNHKNKVHGKNHAHGKNHHRQFYLNSKKELKMHVIILFRLPKEV
jgi:hypothetical protein